MCCFQCHYCNPQRAGDITIGDYWGIEKEHPSFFNTKGVSCILVNTDKGMKLWAKHSKLFYKQESTFDQVARHNENLLHPTKRVANIRNSIYEGIETPGWFKNTFVYSFKPSIVVRVKNLMPVWFKLFIKKFI